MEVEEVKVVEEVDAEEEVAAEVVVVVRVDEVEVDSERSSLKMIQEQL